MRRHLVGFVTVSVSFLAAGCAVPGGARQAANVLSLKTLQIQARASGFADAQREIDRGRVESVAAFRLAISQVESSTAARLEVWRIVGQLNKAADPRVALYEAVRAESERVAARRRADAARAADDSRRAAELEGAIKIDRARMTRIAKGLAALGASRKWKGDATFLVTYAGEVSKEVDRLKAVAKEEAKSAASEAKASVPGH